MLAGRADWMLSGLGRCAPRQDVLRPIRLCVRRGIARTAARLKFGDQLDRGNRFVLDGRSVGAEVVRHTPR